MASETEVRSALTGIACPIVTPFDGDSIDEPAYRSLLDHVTGGGIDAIFPCGTTGEFASMSAGERKRVVELTVDHTDVPVIAGAGATSVAETVDRVEDVEDAGADAAAVVVPYFHTATEPTGNREFFSSILERTSIPLVLYNIPQYTGCPIAVETVTGLAEHDRLVGIKDSSGDLEYHLRLVRETPDDLVVLQGIDPLLVASLRMGSDGGINAMSNVFPSILSETFDTASTERALELQFEAITPAFETCGEHGYGAATKAMLVHRDVLPNAEVRPPLVPVDDASAIERAVDEVVESFDLTTVASGR